jgi:hypothetical protein
MTKKQNKGLVYLKDKALEAHAAGDAFQVLHLCSIAIEYLEKKNKSSLLFEDYQWCISLNLYWETSGLYFFEKEKINKLVDAKSELSRAYIVFIEWLLKLLDGQKNDFPKLSKKFYNFASADECIISLVIYSIELNFVSIPLEDAWFNLNSEIKQNINKNTKLYIALDYLCSRLSSQAKLFWKPLKNSLDTTYLATSPMYNGYQYYFNCDWDSLNELMKTIGKETIFGTSKYIQYIQLDLFYNFYKNETEDRKVAHSKYKLAESLDTNISLYIKELREKTANAFISYTQKNRLESFLTITYKLMIFSLRNWYISDYYYAMQMLRNFYFHEICANNHSDENIVNAILYALKCTGVNIKTNQQLQETLYKFDFLSDDKRTSVIQYILQCPNSELYSAHEIMLLISDAIPEDLLKEVAEWSVNLESEKNTTGWKITYLNFWKDILENISDENFAEMIIVKLKPAIIQSAKNPLLWQELYDFYIQCIIKSDKKIASEIIDIIKNRAIDKSGDSTITNQWGIVFDSCKQSPELWAKYYSWIKEKAKGNSRLELHLNKQTKNQSLEKEAEKRLKKTIINGTCKKIDELLKMDKRDNVKFGSFYSSMMLNLVTWNKNDKKFIDKLIEAMQSSDIFVSSEISSFLVYISRIMQKGSKALFTYITNQIPELLIVECENDHFISNCAELERPKLFLCYNYLLLESNLNKNSSVFKRILSYISTKDYTSNDDSSDFLFLINTYLTLTSDDATEQMLFLTKSEIYTQIMTSDKIKELKRLSKIFNNIKYMFNLSGDKIQTCIINTKNQGAKKNLLKSWESHLLENAKCWHPPVRKAVAGALAQWRLVSEQNTDINFPEDLKSVFEALKTDSRMSVRNACIVDCKDKQG